MIDEKIIEVIEEIIVKNINRLKKEEVPSDNYPYSTEDVMENIGVLKNYIDLAMHLKEYIDDNPDEKENMLNEDKLSKLLKYHDDILAEREDEADQCTYKQVGDMLKKRNEELENDG